MAQRLAGGGSHYTSLWMILDGSRSPGVIEQALKLIYLAIHEASKRRAMPMHHWKPALNHFALLHEDRMPQLS